MPGVLINPGTVPPPPPEVGLEPPRCHGFGNGCLFSAPCWGFVPSKTIKYCQYCYFINIKAYIFSSLLKKKNSKYC